MTYFLTLCREKRWVQFDRDRCIGLVCRLLNASRQSIRINEFFPILNFERGGLGKEMGMAGEGDGV